LSALSLDAVLVRGAEVVLQQATFERYEPVIGEQPARRRTG
jgi:hypothetical protein